MNTPKGTINYQAEDDYRKTTHLMDVFRLRQANLIVMRLESVLVL